MLVQRKSRLIYCLSSKSQIQLQHCCFGYASNARIVQAFKLVDGIHFGEAIGLNNELHSSNSEPNNENFNVDANNKPIAINKAIENNFKCIEQFDKACIKNKHTRIVTSKNMTLITKRLQEVYADLQGPHKPTFILEKNYVALLLDKFIQKS